MSESIAEYQRKLKRHDNLVSKILAITNNSGSHLKEYAECLNSLYEIWKQPIDFKHMILNAGIQQHPDQVFVSLSDGEDENGEVKKHFGADAVRNSWRYNADGTVINRIRAWFNVDYKGSAAEVKKLDPVVKNAIDLCCMIENQILAQQRMLLHFAFSEWRYIKSQKSKKKFDRSVRSLRLPNHERTTNSTIDEEDESDEQIVDDDSDENEEEDDDEQPFYTGSLLMLGGLTKVHPDPKSKLSALEICLNYLYDRAQSKNLCREGSELRTQLRIHRCKLATDEDGHLLCQGTTEKPCSLTEREHGLKIESRTADHVFRPRLEKLKGPKVNTYSWNRPKNHFGIKDWVYSEINSLKGSLYSKGVPIREKLSKEISNAIEVRLPVLQRQRSEDLYGPVNSWINGVFFIKTCEFYTYSQLEEARKNGKYQHLVTNYTDEWFYYDRYMEALRGRRNFNKLTFPESQQYENIVKNRVCRHCLKEELYHNKSCKNPDFSIVQCIKCDAIDEEVSVDNVCVNTKLNCKCVDGPQHYTYDVAKGLAQVPSPLIDSILTKQLDSYSDYLSYLGVYYWLFAIFGYFLMPKTENDWPVCIKKKTNC